MVRPLLTIVLSACVTCQLAMAQPTTAPMAPHANPLLTIDQNRATVIDRIIGDWGDSLAAAKGGIDAEHLRILLEGLRSDYLLAASLTGSLEGLRTVIASGIVSGPPANPALLRTKALGDTGDDLVYTPVTPCRLVETRGTFTAVYQGDGTPSHHAAPFASNEIRNYSVQGGNGSCVAQLPAGLNASAVQLEVFGIPVSASASGDVEILPQGSSFGSTSSLIYLGNEPFVSGSATVRINLGDDQIGVQVRGGGANLAIDVVGYFQAPGGTVLSGSGAANALAKWGPGGTTLGTSAVFEKNGLVGIGTAAPAFALDVVVPFSNTIINLVNGTNVAGARIARYTNRLEISPDDAFQVSVGGVANPHFWIGANGNVGIGNTAPVNHLEIGSAPGFSGNDLAIGNGTKGMSFFQTSAVSNWYSSTNFALMPNTGSGFVGIGTQSPTNRLQVGSVGASSYSNYDVAFGNGSGASGLAQTDSARWDSNTNIALMPVNGQGRVGINTTSPFAPLDVEGLAFTGDGFTYFNFLTNNSLKSCTSCNGNVSIWASNNVMAAEFDARSDVRIKDVVGVSDSSRDLATLNALVITDYTLKDVVQNGAKPFKKVIAQQVEAVYPQVVSKHVDFIPNVYRAASSVTKGADGTLLHFDGGHGLSPGAKRIRMLGSDDHSMQQANIIAVRSAQDVLIDAPRVNGDRVFVYGEEVDDFRTVDYEGLTSLNISATQELAKRLAQKDAQIADLEAGKWYYNVHTAANPGGEIRGTLTKQP